MLLPYDSGTKLEDDSVINEPSEMMHNNCEFFDQTKSEHLQLKIDGLDEIGGYLLGISP